MNSFVNDIFERIAGEASRLGHYNKRKTISFQRGPDRCEAAPSPVSWLNTPSLKAQKPSP